MTEGKQTVVAVSKVLKQFRERLSTGSWDGTLLDLLDSVEAEIKRAVKEPKAS